MQVEEFVRIASSLLVNMGTLSSDWVASKKLAAKEVRAAAAGLDWQMEQQQQQQQHSRHGWAHRVLQNFGELSCGCCCLCSSSHYALQSHTASMLHHSRHAQLCGWSSVDVFNRHARCETAGSGRPIPISLKLLMIVSI
jgi:hypothetical protein